MENHSETAQEYRSQANRLWTLAARTSYEEVLNRALVLALCYEDLATVVESGQRLHRFRARPQIPWARPNNRVSDAPKVPEPNLPP
jgi:hypothetical protein